MSEAKARIEGQSFDMPFRLRSTATQDERRSLRRSLELQKQQQFHVDRHALGPLLLDERRNVRAGHEVDADILMLGAAALAGAAHALDPHEAETFRDHARRRMEVAQ